MGIKDYLPTMEDIHKLMNVGVKVYAGIQAILHPIKFLKGEGSFILNNSSSYLPRTGPFGVIFPGIQPNSIGYCGKGVKLEKSSVSMQLQTIESDIKFNLKLEGDFGEKTNNINVKSLQGTSKFQTAYVVTDPNKFYWKIGNNKEKLREVFEDVLFSSISKAESLNDFEGLKKNALDTLMYTSKKREAKEDKVAKEIEMNYGVRVVDLSMYQLNYDDESKKLLQEIPSAIIASEQSKIFANSTMEVAKNYTEAAKAYKESGSTMELGDLAMELQRRDNDESIAEKNNIHTIFSSPLQNSGRESGMYFMVNEIMRKLGNLEGKLNSSRIVSANGGVY
jgi:hypothetical protein